MRFEVVHTVWGADGEAFAGGVHELTARECPCGVKHGKPTVDMVRLLAGAEAAGAVTILDPAGQRAKLRAHVQTQVQGEKAYTTAQADGSWHEGQLKQHKLDEANPDAPKARVG